jgi:RNA polymerase sigma factor (sigma-70 family)
LRKTTLPSPQTDTELIAACRTHEPGAWDALVDRYARLVYSVALRTGLSQDDAADVFQCVFVALWQSLRSIREPQGLAKWLITTTKRSSWEACRKRGREVTGQEALTEQPHVLADVDAERWESRWADQVMVREALRALGGRCRKLLKMLYYDRSEPSYEQIGDRLGIPLGSVGPTRARCLAKLRDILQTMGMSAT